MLKRILASLIIFISTNSFAMIDAYQLEQLVGWTIIASKQIEGYVDKNGKKSNDFEGCDFDRIIKFTDGTSLTCNSYGYQYAFMPKAILFGMSMEHKGKNVTLYKMLVNNQIYDVY